MVAVTTRPLTPFLKYSNWTISVALFLVGIRVLAKLAAYCLHPDIVNPAVTRLLVGLGIGSILMILASVGVFIWQNWGRRVGIILCAFNFVGAIFVQLVGHGPRIRFFCILAGLILMLVWFFLPKVRAEFKKPE
jgi:hypothetical protein